MMSKLLMALALVLGVVGSAGAVEYRLQVANLYRESFVHYFGGPLGAGSGGVVMERLGRALETDQIPSGALLSDRTFRYGWEVLAGSFRATKVIAEIKPAEGARRWDEVVWSGNPGERSVWVIAPTTTRTQEVVHLAMQGVPVGAGESPALRYYLPYRVTGSPAPQTAVTYPLDFVRFYEGRGPALWDRYLSRSTGLSQGIAAIVGESSNPSFADWVYIVIQHPPKETTFKAVVAWERRRGADRSNIEGGSTRD